MKRFISKYWICILSILLVNEISAQQISNLQTLHGLVPAAIAKFGLKPVGHLDGTKRLSLVIGMPLRNQESLDNLLQQLYDTSSQNYHHYLSVDQFTAQFGPTQGDYQSVIAFAQANGLTVTNTSPNRIILDVSGAVQNIEQAFHVHILVYQHPTEARTFYAPDADPSPNLSTPILHISGLDNFIGHHISHLIKTQNAQPYVGTGPNGSGYMGKDFRAAYVPGVTLDGSGQIVGMLELDGMTIADIQTYEAKAGISPVEIDTVLIDGYDGSPHRNSYEVDLDIEMAISMAPKLKKIILYESPDDWTGQWDDILNRMTTDNLAKQMSCSWGDSIEFVNAVADQHFKEMAAQGQSFFCASGDNGAYTASAWYNNFKYYQSILQFPCSDPYVTLVGGTNLTTNGAGGPWSSEVVWNDGYVVANYDYEASGGGISAKYSIPSWQQSVSMYANHGSTTMRNIPDVALTAANVYTPVGSQDNTATGTSCAAPLWAGFIALVNQQAKANGDSTVGFINPAIYKLAGNSSYTNYFHDITSGNNEWPGSPNQFYAVSGYDLCTGLGTPTGQALINSLAPMHITVDQRLSTNAQVGTIGRWNGVTFPTARLQPGSIITVNSGTEVLQGDQVIYSTQKYNSWIRNQSAESDVLNHHLFTVQSTDNKYLSQFTPTNTGVTIQGNLIEAPTLTTNVGFSDPWFIDYPDPSYGNVKRNEGMSAPFASRTSPFHPDTTTSYSGNKYLGVFTNQSGPPQWNPPYYTVSFPSQTVSVGGTNHTLYFLNWSKSGGAVFKDSTKDTTAVVFTSSSVTATANVKGTQLSNDGSAFSDNSQRKFVRTPNGWLHHVYTSTINSVSHVWYEMSTDGGTTWTLQSPQPSPGGVPGYLDIGGGKCPSIDYSHNSSDPNSIAIVFQQVSGTYYTIQLMTYIINNNQWTLNLASTVQYPEPAGGDPYATTNANPSIIWGSASSGLLTWERKSIVGIDSLGINYMAGTLNRNGFSSSMIPTRIPTTTNNSINATTSYSAHDGKYYTAWEQDVNSTRSSIQWSSLPSNGTPKYQTPSTISTSAFSKNYKPSLVASDTSVQCCWIGDVDGSGQWMNVSALERQIGYTTIQRYGAGVKSVSMNKDNTSNYYFAYSQYVNNTWSNSVVGGKLPLKTLNTTGQDVQLCNGPASTNMVVSSYYPFTLPYYFQTSNSLGGLSKTNAGVISNGRGAAVEKDNIGFYYSIGDITLDGNPIDFVNADKKGKYSNLDTLNAVLLSQPFTLKSNSVFNFSENSGAADSSAAGNVLGANGFLSFTVQLVDAASGKVIGTAKQLKLTSSSLPSYKLSSYTVSVTGLGGKTAQLKISIQTNVDSLSLLLVEQHAGVNVSALSKIGMEELLVKSSEIIMEYALEQNYPNPFNPSTTINFQISNAGYVTLKVYDVLGREVATLVDGVKEAGSYSATFDGGKLASGVYIMRLVAHSEEGKSFVQTKKMLLMK
jgi:hypothetical protein